MPKTMFTQEEIIRKLWEVEVLLGQGQPIEAVCQGLGLSDQTWLSIRVCLSAEFYTSLGLDGDDKSAASSRPSSTWGLGMNLYIVPVGECLPYHALEE